MGCHIGYPISDMSNIGPPNPISDIQYRIYPISSFQTRYWISNVEFPNPILEIQHPILDNGYFQYPMLGIRVMYACTLYMSVYILTQSLFVVFYASIHRHIPSFSWMWIVDMGLMDISDVGFQTQCRISNIGF